jgi:hypothetical protein
LIATKRTNGFWRQLTGCAVAYVLVLQAFLIALSGAQLGLAKAAGGGSLAVELCVHDAGDVPASPDRHSDKDHCALCVVCGHHLLAGPAPTSPWVFIGDRGVVPWPAKQRLVATTGERPDHRPRGPPRTA